MPPTIKALGDTRDDAERHAIAYLRDHLPDGYTVLHSAWLRHGRQSWELDLIILTPHSICIMDVKNVHGRVDVHHARWHPSGRGSYKSPVPKLEMHARELKSMLAAHDALLGRVFIRSAVVLTAPGVSLHDHTGRDQPHVVHLRDIVPFLQDSGSVPEWAASRIGHLHNRIVEAIAGKASPRPAARRFGEWEAVEHLGGDEEGEEYQARHLRSGETVRVREYRADPYLSEADQRRQLLGIETAFVALDRLSHPNVVRVRSFFQNEEGDGWVLVSDEPAGETLRARFAGGEAPLSTTGRVGIMRDVLAALAHAHARGVVHRQIRPDAVLVGEQTLLSGFDYARVPRVDGGTISSQIADQMHGAYVAPECVDTPGRATAASDVFSAGLLFFELLAGGRAFDTAEQMIRASAVFPHPPGALRPTLPPALDGWLQALCAWEPSARPGAAEALRRLQDIIPAD